MQYSTPLPKIIWMLWLQGIETAPDIVKACVRSWQVENPDWTIHVVSRTSLHEFLPNISDPRSILNKQLPDAALSDVIRLELLARYGGVWIDATCFCLRPLDSWIENAASDGFFAFSKPSEDRLLSSWFIAAHQSSYLLHEWRRLVYNYWEERESFDEYFWFHKIFGSAYENDSEFRSQWDAVLKISASTPHYFIPYHQKLMGALTPEGRDLIENRQAPLLKLTHRVDHATVQLGSVYRYLCDKHGTTPMGHRSATGLLTRPARQVADAQPIVTAWFGTLDGHGTIGDFFAAQSVNNRLAARGYRFSNMTASPEQKLLGQKTNVHEPLAQNAAWLVFVCGPIIKGHPVTSEIVERLPDARKVAVSVSVFPVGHENYVQPFDIVIAREGLDKRWEDVAILAENAPRRARRLVSDTIILGVVLRGSQGEYGLSNTLNVKVDEMIAETIKALSSKFHVKVVEIDHHLIRADKPPQEIENSYDECDLIITTRFHGAILALRREIPFVAIDQISGGAKLISLLQDKGWPFLFRADQISTTELVDASTALLSGVYSAQLQDIKYRTLARAEETLYQLETILLPKKHAAAHSGWRNLLHKGLALLRLGS